MSEQEEKPFHEKIIGFYRSEVEKKYPQNVLAWPILSGKNTKYAQFGNWSIVFYEHTGNPVFTTNSGIGELPQSLIGFPEITESNKDRVRERLERHFSLKPSDGIVFIPPNGDVGSELSKLLHKHEYAMGLTPMKIFLSHKGIDKETVRDFKKSLESLGFDPWIDEDAMHAGVELERGILQGFNDSCAAVFFVTPNFKDELFLGSEVNYAISEKRKKSDKFSIVTLVFNQNGVSGEVPALLQPYVWKEPKTDLEALREIIKALPVKTGMVQWK